VAGLAAALAIASLTVVGCAGRGSVAISPAEPSSSSTVDLSSVPSGATSPSSATGSATTGPAQGTGTAGSTPTGTGIGTASEVLVTVERSGGIAGTRDTVVVHGDGAWTATRRNGATTSGRLTPTKLASLRTLVDGSAWRTEASASATSVCADGFVYVVTVGGQSARTNDCSLARQPTLTTLTRTVMSDARL
jgi:hypothetical protein